MIRMASTDNLELYKQIRHLLEHAHSSRLKGIVLYGSEARGEAQEDSDIDLLVLLQGPVDFGVDLETNIEALLPLSLEIGRRISAKPIDIEQYNSYDCPLFSNARREGVAV